MKKIGIIVAMKSEFQALYNEIGKLIETINTGDIEIYHFKRNNLDIYVTDTAEGEIAASCMTQYLITKFEVEMILNFGLCGSLKPQYKCSEIVAVKSMVHYGFDLTDLCHDYKIGQYPIQKSNVFETDSNLLNLLNDVAELPNVKVASSDKFVGNEDDKKYLIDKFDADICEMESAGIVLCCKWNNIPCLLIKCISDNAAENAHLEFREVVKTGINQYVNVIIKLLDKMASAKEEKK